MTLELIRRLPINHSFSGNNQYRAWVRCTCGKEYETGFYSYSKSPGCRSCVRRGADNVVPNTLLGRVRRGAIARKIHFELTLDDLRQRHSDQTQPGERYARCMYSGKELIFHGTKDSQHNVSVDRRDSNGGYALDNIDLVTKQVNIAKHTMTPADLLFHVERSVDPKIFFLSPAPVTSYRASGIFTGDRISGFRQRAKKKGLSFSLDAHQLRDMFNRQNGTCALFGMPLDETNVSIDRLDNSKGYTYDNIQLVTKEANFMRGPLSLDDFRELLDDIYEWNFIKKKGFEVN